VAGRISADQVRQQPPITRIALSTRRRVPFPVTGHRHRVDRIHPVTRRDQRSRPRAPVGLDPSHHLARAITLGHMADDQLMQPGDPGHALRQPGPGQPPASLIHQPDIVMIL
jgi:hypothetical protein